MKKEIAFALAFCFITSNGLNAQTKSETHYGPEKGMFALSVGADPVIDFVGNMFNGSTDNSIKDLGLSFAGKYFTSDRFAITAGIEINNDKTKSFNYNGSDYDDITYTETKGNKRFSLNVGTQYYFRTGKRFQPFIGANIYFGRKNDGYTIQKAVDVEDYYVSGLGRLELGDTYYKRSTPTNEFGLVAKVGVEYFIGKRVSISGALDLGVQTKTNKIVSKLTSENDLTEEQFEKRNYNYKKSRTTSFGTGLLNGNIAFNFYF